MIRLPIHLRLKIETLKLKNEAFVRDLLQKWHVGRALGLRIPMRFSDFQVNSSKVLRLPACHELEAQGVKERKLAGWGLSRGKAWKGSLNVTEKTPPKWKPTRPSWRTRPR